MHKFIDNALLFGLRAHKKPTTHPMYIGMFELHKKD
jgi:hypothetical protein